MKTAIPNIKLVSGMGQMKLHKRSSREWDNGYKNLSSKYI